jgi:hypothetical protein
VSTDITLVGGINNPEVWNFLITYNEDLQQVNFKGRLSNLSAMKED